MFGNFFFQSLTQEFSIEGALEFQGAASRFEFDLGSNMEFQTSSSLAVCDQPEVSFELPTVSVESASANWNSEFGSLETNYEQTQMNQGGIQLTAESSDWQWDSGLFQSEWSHQSVELVSDSETSLQSDTAITTAMNVESNSFSWTGLLGTTTVSTEQAITSEVVNDEVSTMMQSTGFEWSFQSPLGGFQVNRTSQTAIIMTESNPVADAEVCLDNQWIQRSVANSISLEFGANTGNPGGSLLGRLATTQSTTAINMGSGHLKLGEQQLDGFAQFCGTKTNGSWLGQTQTGLDLSLAIA